MPKRLISLVLLLVATTAWGNFGPVSSDQRDRDEEEYYSEITDPVLLSPLIPEYPESLIGTDWTGECMLGFYIDEEGDVRKAWIIRSTGRHDTDEAAVEAALNSEWEPATHEGKAIAYQSSVTFHFTPPEADADTAEPADSSTTTEP